MGAKSFPWALSTLRENGQGTDLASIFGYIGKSEKLSESKPPLLFRSEAWHQLGCRTDFGYSFWLDLILLATYLFQTEIIGNQSL
jgi:hypothetical protein